MPGLLQAITIAPCSSAAVYVNTGTTPAAVSLNLTSLCSTLNNTLTVGVYNSTACPCAVTTTTATTFCAACIGAIVVDNSCAYVGQSYSGTYNTHPCYYSAAGTATGGAGFTMCNYYSVLTCNACFSTSNLNTNGWPTKGCLCLETSACCCTYYSPVALYNTGITSLTNTFRINYAAASIKASMNQIYSNGLSIAPIATGCVWGSSLAFVCACSTCNLTWNDAAVLNSCRRGGLPTTCTGITWCTCYALCLCLCCATFYANGCGTLPVSKVAADLWSDSPTIWNVSYQDAYSVYMSWEIANINRSRCDGCAMITGAAQINTMNIFTTGGCQSDFYKYCNTWAASGYTCPNTALNKIYSPRNVVHAGCRFAAFTSMLPQCQLTIVYSYQPCINCQSLSYYHTCCASLAYIGDCYNGSLFGAFNSAYCASCPTACLTRTNCMIDGTVKWAMYDHINCRNVVYVDSSCISIAGIYTINNTGWSVNQVGMVGCKSDGSIHCTSPCSCAQVAYSWATSPVATKLSGVTCSGGYIPCDDLNPPFAYVTMPYMYADGVWESYKSCYNSSCSDVNFSWNGCMLRFISQDLVTWCLATGSSKTYICDLATGTKTSYESIAASGILKTVDNFYNPSCFCQANYIENKTSSCNLQRTGLVIGTNQSIIVANDSAACVAAQVWGVN